MKNERRLRSFLVFAILGLALLCSYRFYFRADLTQNRTYTLSPVTRDCLGSLDSEVTVTWYRSEALARLTPSVRYIADFLSEYREAGRGRFGYRVIDPDTVGVKDPSAVPGSSPSAGFLGSLGLISRQIEVREGDGTVTRDLYSGFLVEYGGQSRVIPFLIDMDRLEYDLTRLILDLTRASSGAPGSGAQAITVVFAAADGKTRYPYVDPWLSYAGFDVREPALPLASLEPRTPLVVIGSSALDPQSVAAIGEYLDAGGNAAFFVSGNTVKTDGDWTATGKKGDGLLRLLADRGFSVEPGLLMDNANYRITLPALDNSRYEYVNYPFWVTSLSSETDQEHPLLSGVRTLQFYWPSPLYTASEKDAGVRGLVRSSASSSVMPEPFNTNPFGGQTVSGSGSGGPAFLLAAGTVRGRLVLVPDEYFPSTMIEYTASDSNLDFLVNCAEWISGRDALLTLKKVLPGPETTITDDAAFLSALSAVRAVNVLIVPAVLAAVWLAFRLRRKRP